VSLEFFIYIIYLAAYGPGVDSASNTNAKQNISWEVKADSALGWQPYHIHVPTTFEIWEP